MIPSGCSPSEPLVGSAGIRGVVNDAISIHLADATIASVFVARWCAAQRAEIADGLFRVRDDEPMPRSPAARQIGASAKSD
jgi:hypothetical protein